MDNYIYKLNIILSTHNVCSSHGITHAIAVMNHAENALNQAENALNQAENTLNQAENTLNQTTFKFDEKIKRCVKLAALLHDADDRKFFPNNQNYENLRQILDDLPSDEIDLIIKMISLVSSSKNGDRIPEDAIKNEWLLYPRYADRLEAIGIIGIERCFQYALTSKNPLYISTTPYVTTEEELWKVASIERYNRYTGYSDSMIDHYYDKLLCASIFPIRNKYFDKETELRRKPLIDFILMFGKNKQISNEDIITFIKNRTKKLI
jgi:uncharacterized protein